MVATLRRVLIRPPWLGTPIALTSLPVDKAQDVFSSLCQRRKGGLEVGSGRGPQGPAKFLKSVRRNDPGSLVWRQEHQSATGGRMGKSNVSSLRMRDGIRTIAHHSKVVVFTGSGTGDFLDIFRVSRCGGRQGAQLGRPRSSWSGGPFWYVRGLIAMADHHARPEVFSCAGNY